jgi:diaminohydroxyphosphoribosylaminopyrimidine deaminase / 5-amino-6-(5-phosphoribosylamino)uracil reductase
MLYQRPFGILKYAMTLDGKIAASSGHSTWVTSPASRDWVHQLRSDCDAIIVGGNTVRRDNPLLTSHGKAHNPLRVVMSRRLDLPTKAQFWETKTLPTLVLTTTLADIAMQKSLEQQGVEVIITPDLTPDFVMQLLYERGCLSALWECGGTLAASAISARAIQKIFAFIAAKIIGGISAPAPVGDLGLTEMTQAIQLEKTRWQTVGTDLLVTGYLPKPPIPAPDQGTG